LEKCGDEVTRYMIEASVFPYFFDNYLPNYYSDNDLDIFVIDIAYKKAKYYGIRQYDVIKKIKSAN
jgi:hypothetical protein